MASRKYTLNNGTEIPAVGLGTWQSKPGEVEKVSSLMHRLTDQAIVYAIDKVGYRLIDGYTQFPKAFNQSAWGYGNEVEVGKALKECQIPRTEIFVTVIVPPGTV